MLVGGTGVRGGLSAGFGRGMTGRAQFHACAAGFGQADGDRLLGGPRTVFAFADVVHFFAHKFAGLGGGGFSFLTVFLGSPDGFPFRHK